MRPEGERLAFISMCVDFLHAGHMNVILEARKYGGVVIGLLSDKAILSYKRKPICTYEQRKIVAQNIKGVVRVVKQPEHDLVSTIRRVKPDYVVNGDDWKTGNQSHIRQTCIDALKEWGGELIEIPYTEGISSTNIIKRINSETEENVDEEKNSLNSL